MHFQSHFTLLLVMIHKNQYLILPLSSEFISNGALFSPGTKHLHEKKTLTFCGQKLRKHKSSTRQSKFSPFHLWYKYLLGIALLRWLLPWHQRGVSRAPISWLVCTGVLSNPFLCYWDGTTIWAGFMKVPSGVSKLLPLKQGSFTQCAKASQYTELRYSPLLQILCNQYTF